MYACNDINLMHYLSSVYSLTITLYYSGLQAAHNQEVTMYICVGYIHCYLLMIGNYQSRNMQKYSDLITED
jgi:hypothetical protein